MENFMFFMKNEKKKRHPYIGLAMFTLAAASVINVTNKAKKFVKGKVECVTGMFKKMTD